MIIKNEYVRGIVSVALLASLACSPGAPAFAATTGPETPHEVIKNIGDIVVYVVPATAFGMTLGARDGPGTTQFLGSAGVTMAVVAGLKYTVKSRRPNGNPQSFPSGHTAIAVQSAEFLGQHYGWKYGIPAYVSAAYVGYSRIASREHHPRDVIAGAAIAFVGAHFMTKPYKGNLFQLQVSDAGTPTLLYSRQF